MTEEEKRDGRIIWNMEVDRLKQRIVEIKEYSDIETEARACGMERNDYLWSLFCEIEEEVKVEFQRLKTLRLKTEFMRGEFEREHGETLKQFREEESLRQATARRRHERQRRKYLN